MNKPCHSGIKRNYNQETSHPSTPSSPHGQVPHKPEKRLTELIFYILYFTFTICKKI